MSARIKLCLLGLAAALAQPASAQDDPDALIAASQQVDGAMTLAQRQVAGRDLLGAVGTLERLLFVYPEAVPPRLLYASLPGRLDDPQVASVDCGQLAELF